MWKPRWELVPENLNAFPQEETAPPEPALKKSFEELALEKIKGPTDWAPAPRRMKVDLTAKVIMQKEYLEVIKRAEEKKKVTKKTQLSKEVSDNECDDFFNEEEVNELSESETKSEDEISNIDVMLKTWKFFNPPTSEDDIIGGWYAGIFSNKKHTMLYIGKTRRRFLGNVDGPCVSVELDCLKPNVSSSTVFESTPDNLPDIGNFHTEDIIAGPLIVKPLHRKKWEVPMTTLKRCMKKLPK